MDLIRSNYNWFVVYTKANQEKKLKRQLDELKIDNYLPLTKSLRQWSDRKKWIEKPLFFCYIFVRVSNVEYFKVLRCSGVVRYVCFGGKPHTIPDWQIDNIKTMVQQKESELVVTREHIQKGVKARVLYGPLKGVKGEIVKLFGKTRLLIRIESIGCSLYSNISKDEIELLPIIPGREINRIHQPRLSKRVSGGY